MEEAAGRGAIEAIGQTKAGAKEAHVERLTGKDEERERGKALRGTGQKPRTQEGAGAEGDGFTNEKAQRAERARENTQERAREGETQEGFRPQ